jgi:nitroreductase
MLFPNEVTLDPAWYDAIAKRLSRRAFDGRPVPAGELAELRRVGETFRPSPLVRVEIVAKAPGDIFTGYVGSYGSVRGAATVAAFIGREGSESAIGYVGEAIVLEATRLGLETCWVAGSFDRKRTSKVFRVAGDERVMSITPIGFAVKKLPADERLMRAGVRSSSRKPLSELAPGSEGWPAWARDAAEAARWAPTGGNGQPQRLRMEDGALVVSRASKAYWTAGIDLGIVMLHAELGALHAGVSGAWEELPAPDAARLVPVP